VPKVIALIEQMFDTGEMEAVSLREQMRRIAPVVLAAEQVLPVPEVFHQLLPGGGLQRGWITRITGGPSARALAWAMLADVTTAGGWIATVDVPGISLTAAQELGVAIERLLVVRTPDTTTWSATVGALIGAVDVVAFGSPAHRITPSEHRRMASRARERGTVLLELDAAIVARSRPSQLPYDLSFLAEPIDWVGLGRGHGCLQGRVLDVESQGRRIGGGVRSARYELPATDGTVRLLEEHATVTALHAR